jgi:hypothetical protein
VATLPQQPLREPALSLFLLFLQESSATDIVFAAEILEFRPRGP